MRSDQPRDARERVKYFLFCSFCSFLFFFCLFLSLLCSLFFRFSRNRKFFLPSFDLASSIFGVFKQKLKLICLLFALSFFVLTENSDECAKSRAVSHIIVSSSHEAAVCVCVCERERESKREQKRAWCAFNKTF